LVIAHFLRLDKPVTQFLRQL